MWRLIWLIREGQTELRIAEDAIGGDYAPEQIVEGALLAAELGNVQISLTGDDRRLKALVGGKAGGSRL